MRQCPKCGEMFPEDRKVCTTRGCKRRTIEVIDWTDEDEARAMKDLEDGIMADPFEDYKAKPKPKAKPKSKPEPEPGPEEDPVPEPDLREDLKGQSDQIHDILENVAPLTYEDLGGRLNPPVSGKRASRIIGQMIRDGVELKREGTPRKVSLG